MKLHGMAAIYPELISQARTPIHSRGDPTQLLKAEAAERGLRSIRYRLGRRASR